MMAKYRKKPVVIEAVQWSPIVQGMDCELVEFPHDFGKIWTCGECGCESDTHGWIGTLEGGYHVCQGDWIITGVAGEHYPCKPNIFIKTYEPVATLGPASAD
jgi:hypothetical protein